MSAPAASGPAVLPRWPGLWLRTSASVEVDLLWLSLFHHADHSVAGVMFDRVVVGTSRIGCGG
jgi:hypothetical protein